jgi:hypothetical protein
MLKIPMPANLLKMLNAIVEIINLGIIPKKYIKAFISKFAIDSKGSSNESFKEGGYDSGSII